MRDIAHRFVAEWIDEYVKNVRYDRYSLELVEDLARKLEHDAWEFGLSRKQFLAAVDGKAYKFVSFEVEKTSERDFRIYEGAPRPTPFLRLVRVNGKAG